MLRPFPQHDNQVNPLRLASLPPLPSGASSQLPCIPCHYPANSWISHRSYNVAATRPNQTYGWQSLGSHELPHKEEIAGAFSQLHGSQPTHSPARPMPIPDQRPDRLAAGALCASTFASSSLHLLLSCVGLWQRSFALDRNGRQPLLALFSSITDFQCYSCLGYSEGHDDFCSAHIRHHHESVEQQLSSPKHICSQLRSHKGGWYLESGGLLSHLKGCHNMLPSSAFTRSYHHTSSPEMLFFNQGCL